MKIRIWGCRGSLTTPGPQTVRYGGNTTCVEVEAADGTVIVLDAGSGLKNLGQDLVKRNGARSLLLFVTHTHWDHLVGFPFFAPGYDPDFQVHVCGGPLAKGFLEETLETQMRPPYFPVAFRALRARFDFTVGDPLSRQVGSCFLEPIKLNHPNGGHGVKITEEGRSMVFLPDNELDFSHEEGMSRDRYVEICDGADLLIHDSQYTAEEYRTRRGWGHSRVSDTVRLAQEAGVKRLCLFHHDPDHTDDDMDRIAAAARKQAGMNGDGRECFAAREGMEITV